MRKAMRHRKKTKKKTPGKRNVWVVKKKRVSHSKCGICKGKLNRGRFNKLQVKKLTKTKRRPSRPYPELCSKCMRAKIKRRVS